MNLHESPARHSWLGRVPFGEGQGLVDQLIDPGLAELDQQVSAAPGDADAWDRMLLATGYPGRPPDLARRLRAERLRTSPPGSPVD
jgi:hypothetical protein